MTAPVCIFTHLAPRHSGRTLGTSRHVMKAFCALLFASVLWTSCSGEHDGFQSKLRAINVGMSKKQVEEMLGKPGHVYTRSNYWGTWLVGTSEWWKYWDNTNTPPVRDGEVWFDEHGGVRYVSGQNYRITPPQ
jgi:hypothetical protein